MAPEELERMSIPELLALAKKVVGLLPTLLVNASEEQLRQRIKAAAL